MYIEDEELRTLYRDASTDHLDKLEAGFLHLEKHPDDLPQLKKLLRATHSLKGDSRMLGVQDAETLTHQLEDLLSSVEQGERRLTPALCDCLYQGLDAVRKIAHEAITGEAANVSVFHVLAQLMNAGEKSVERPEPAESPDEDQFPHGSETEESRSPDRFINSDGESVILLPPVKRLDADDRPSTSDMVTPGAEVISSAPGVTDTKTIDTIRVEAPKLDVLMTQAGELAVTQRRITRRIDDIDQMIVFWESLAEEQLTPLGDLLKQLRANAYEDSAQLETLSNDLASGILKLRQLPLSNLFNLFPRLVRDLAKQQDKTVNLLIEGGDTQADKRILEEMKAPLTHLIRNAIDHGIEAPSEHITMGKPPAATVWLKAHQRGSHIEIDVIDDGRGLSLESIKRTAVRRGLYTEAALAKMSVEQLHNLIFAPGFSTRTTVTEISGRGVGLDVVRVNVERLKGLIQVTSSPAQGCTFRFTLNTSLATASALIVEVNQMSYAIPVEFVEMIMRVERQDIFNLEGNPAILLEENPLSVAWLTDLLELPVSVATQPMHPIQSSIPCVVLNVGSERLGIFVDALVDQQDIVLKPHSKLLKRVRNIAGATILGTGDVCMVLSPQDLLRSVQAKNTDGSVRPVTDWDMPSAKPKVLLVEDSIPIRTQVCRILEGAGYQVTTAVDGLDGFEKLQQGESFAAVVSDVEMPNLDGLELTTRIRQETKYENLPIILVTTLAQDDDKRRGAASGANAYITKGDFDQSLLIHTLRSLM
ncbi:hybrid sensor histidine kinase/response regulator [Leptolyngbya cf. ectocarpi LEGE 11479]|uniref:histidine kinase n=1 Tax=Leptolyngbya cf. ectocarpi LEGE 11479 TaxID=1828722 RepID=A0A928X263_LEPEC|nr:hybrid sensor histidine kinase/response regulator [Leptolyngbya ectocarpi]MBE9066001.1 hybrid sensor histidine kinase/response regulator [Leptolyngbya cf. ectocarpi LEGE 11479]